MPAPLPGAAEFLAAAKLAEQASFFRTRFLLSQEGFAFAESLHDWSERGANAVNAGELLLSWIWDRLGLSARGVDPLVGVLLHLDMF